jgi:predicted dithiol-disulfide oxidoreductase (DUF899 family)
MKIEAMEREKTGISGGNPHKIVSKAEWLVARKDLLKREKELTHLRDQIDQEHVRKWWNGRSERTVSSTKLRL